jgi:hypothetical protein
MRGEELIDLSYYLIRLGQVNEAMEVLRRDPIAQRNRDFGFMLSANLATIYQMNANGGSARERLSNLGKARDYLEDALAAWPRKGWPGWDKAQADWYRQVEQHNLALIYGRLQETREQARSKERSDDKPFEDVDAIFPLNLNKGNKLSLTKDKKSSLNFVGENGQYKAGELAAVEKAKLKGNELPIVQQLLTWLPQDDRLYWLMGELLNARNANGDVGTAYSILDDLVWTRKVSNVESNVELLKKHRTVLAEALIVEEPTWFQRYWHYLVIGGVAGGLVIVLAYFQIRENRKRRARSIPGPHP